MLDGGACNKRADGRLFDTGGRCILLEGRGRHLWRWTVHNLERWIRADSARRSKLLHSMDEGSWRWRIRTRRLLWIYAGGRQPASNHGGRSAGSRHSVVLGNLNRWSQQEWQLRAVSGNLCRIL